MLGSSMARAILVALLSAAVAAVPAGAAGRKPPSIYESPLLWATVNVCDTAGQPDTIGIRGSIPGSGVRGEKMYLRFQVQYFSRSEKRWHNIVEGADSGWVTAGGGGLPAPPGARGVSLPPPPPPAR